MKRMKTSNYECSQTAIQKHHIKAEMSKSLEGSVELSEISLKIICKLANPLTRAVKGRIEKVTRIVGSDQKQKYG